MITTSPATGSGVGGATTAGSGSGAAIPFTGAALPVGLAGGLASAFARRDRRRR